jgi:hypothetical protein
MSYPAIPNVQYRFTEGDGMPTHRAMGQIPQDAQIERGWDGLMERIRSAAQEHSH